MQATIKLRNGQLVEVEIDYHYSPGEAASWDSPGEPAHLEIEEIRYARTGNRVQAKLAPGEWARIDVLVERGYEQDQWDRAGDLAEDRDCDCYYDDPRVDYIYDPLRG